MNLECMTSYIARRKEDGKNVSPWIFRGFLFVKIYFKRERRKKGNENTQLTMMFDLSHFVCILLDMLHT